MTPEQPSPQPSRLPDAVLRPAVGNVFETTVEQLATAIRLGVFVVGEQLPPERDLAERLGVSRNTLREAIAALRDSGLVTTRRGRGGGTLVTSTGHDDAATSTVRHGAALEDALDFRRVVEPGAARLAATRRLSGDQRAWLLESATAVRSAALADHRIADSRLHLAIATLTGSPMVVEAVTRAQAALGELLAAIPVLRTNIEHSHDQHDAIVEAVLQGDPDTARTTMEEHCDATSALLRGLIG
ncbi:FadR/GntR family transcriptional regulator [Oryzobacter sp. R7]|uniref:FadR/GntR family transcriptional regulator n=1 Tax=Oryzobacter faecalis TaxID=3388656 RepID=UPI00398D3C48